jgi:hypothetical protein
LFKDNENDGYTSELVESNIPKDNNDESNISEGNNKKRKSNPVFLLAKSNSNIKPTTNSNLYSPTPYIFKKILKIMKILMMKNYKIYEIVLKN